MISSLSEDFEITTALRNDGILLHCPANASGTSNDHTPSTLYMTSRHIERMLAAVQAFGWPESSQRQVFSLEQEIRAHLSEQHGNTDPPGPFKVRVALSSGGAINITTEKIKAIPAASLFPNTLSEIVDTYSIHATPTFRLFVSPKPSLPSLFTKHKTTQRATYDDVRLSLVPLSQNVQREGSALPVEVLLVNASDEIMEGSITSAFFYRGGQWITPSARCGGNLGTTRQYALDNGLCIEGIVARSSLTVGEPVILSNGVRGFGWGKFEQLEAQ